MEEEEVLTLTTFPALYFARDLNSASVVNADAYDARDHHSMYASRKVRARGMRRLGLKANKGQ